MMIITNMLCWLNVLVNVAIDSILPQMEGCIMKHTLLAITGSLPYA